jgi:four helix bundle protein
MTSTKTYKDLVLWQRAFEVTKLVVLLLKKLPHSIEVRIILNQLLRAVFSIGANIAEGYGRFGSKEFPRFLQVSLGSANEVEYWLLILKEVCPGFVTEIDKVIAKNSESIKMLASSIRTLRNKNKGI